ncbi:hypothetical protein W97_02077 [Coniosporium apollinis CBS 100218]|uniref:DUF7580 domain-containing protein n=1 Tax=Coniosporium apollinis (strain CBS 100218) TaxID=1168221 RepID=R7YLQ5_CONA1|nr:uncharacterized protein W97_02077 [Coniosporium apollinis CBS 100218]EON62852.1 hypothetical protein W97_02077 [Coniosporium apollinis CBS 100218]
MSGLEVAGVVLGVLPLLVSALEHYNEGLDPIKAFWGWERELPQFIRKLRNQHVHYEQTLKLLLAPITEDAELADMVANPGQGLWKDAEIAIKLENRLNESYKAYIGTIADIEGIMKKIASKLDLGSGNSMTRDNLETLLSANPQKADNKFEFSKRIKFSISKKRIKGLLEDLNECNKELERFTDKSERLEPYRSAWKASQVAPLQRVQRYAKRLHDVLSLAWTCSCNASHSTTLRLEPRAITARSKNMKIKGRQGDVTCFKVCFSSSSSPWTWQEAEIRVEDQPSDQGSLRTPGCSGKVQFTTLPPTPSPPAESRAGGPSDSLKTDLQEIDDICHAICKANLTTPRAGFLLDPHGKLRGIYPVDDDSHQASAIWQGQTVTLKDLLGGKGAPLSKSDRLTRRERYMLAVTLASSILQLHTTPWLTNRWDKNDIIFLRAVGGPHSVDASNPYIVHKQLHPSLYSSGGLDSFGNQNSALLALGLMLLELYFGGLYEQQHSFSCGPDFANIDTALGMLQVAHQWVKEEKENLSAGFLGAVSYCLRCYADPRSSLQDPVCLQAALENIVLPLHEELCHFMGTI